ncbi:hypothetical protein P4V47_03125 [Brevibacillus laterosporus]|uniref:hypothetical protein n=1 Tax=Brevibacillus laterosporus TaxID=1465 RepID=UPI002E1D1F0F|nr:hypothetical protein [Brevibacillus laterosporus]
MSSEKNFRDTVAFSGTFLRVMTKAEISHPTYERLFEMMRSRGWKIQVDQDVLARYPGISADYFEGKKDELRFKSHKYPTGFELEFYQEINTINRNGGKYDSYKLSLMPYLIRCRFLVELSHIKKFLLSEGYTDNSDPVFKTAWEEVNHRIKSCWHYEEDKADKQPNYNATDKAGKRLRDGEVKYFRDRKGRLQRGVVYHNINNMWWVILNRFEFSSKACFELFDLDKVENKVRKLIKPSGHHNPKARQTPPAEQIEKWNLVAKKAGKEYRVEKANEILSYLFSINWLSRKFQLYLKETGRLGLQELESNAWGINKIFDNPVELSLYARCLPMSSTESSWVKGLRDYVVHGKSSLTKWFCNDRNGEGPTAHKWPEVRERLWKIGALAS